MAKQLEKSELEKVQELNNKLGQLKNQLGDLELNLADTKKAKADVLKAVEDVRGEFRTYGDELQEKYGKDISINVQDGTISELPAPNKEVEDDNKGNS